MLADVRYALRTFARNPLFAFAIVLVLGLGIGASTTVFTLVDAYLLKPLPFHEPERLVSLWRTKPDRRDNSPFSVPDLLDVKEQAKSFARVAAVTGASLNLGGEPGALPETVMGSRVDADFFPVFGVTPAIGRTFSPDEDSPGHNHAVILSDALWRRRFSADPGVIGRTITLDGKPHQVVGVMPADLRLPLDLWSAKSGELWVPAALTREGAQRGSHSWNLVARLAPSASPAAADAELRALASRLAQDFPDTNTNKTFFLVGLGDYLASDVRPALTILFFSTLLLLVIASANVALLLLARAAAREGEAAVRAALGASRRRLVRQFLVESVVLALFGGLVGFALSFVGVGLVAAGYKGAAFASHALHPDVRVFGFSLLLASLAGLGFGLAPALRGSKTRLYELLKEGASRSTSSGQRRRVQGGLLVAEVALSTVLLAGSAAVARGFYTMLNQPMGFSTEKVLTFKVRLPKARYESLASTHDFYGSLLAKLHALPSVSSVGAANFIPLGNNNSDGSFEIEGRPPWAPGSEPMTQLQRIDGDYFRTMGVPLLRGRVFGDADVEKGAPVMIIDETFARSFFGDEDPVGKRVRWGQQGAWREVVGVVGGVKYSPTYAGPKVASYVPYRQEEEPPYVNVTAFVIKSSSPPAALANAAREAVRQLDADLPIFDLKTYEERASDSLADRRFTLWLVTSFSLSALVLTALGLFGLVSYQTKRRSRELAIRMALGAASADVQRLVLRDTSRLLIAGLALGLPAAFASGRLLASELQGVPPADPLTLAATALLLGLVALAAVLAPARRAARTPPALVLRDE